MKETGSFLPTDTQNKPSASECILFGESQRKKLFWTDSLWRNKKLLKLHDGIDGSTYQAFSPLQRVYFSGKRIRFQLNIKKNPSTLRTIKHWEAIGQRGCKTTTKVYTIWTICSCQPCLEPMGCITHLQRCLLLHQFCTDTKTN